MGRPWTDAQPLPGGDLGGRPWQAFVVGLANEHLPTGTMIVTPAERKQQLAERVASYQIRLIDH